MDAWRAREQREGCAFACVRATTRGRAKEAELFASEAAHARQRALRTEAPFPHTAERPLQNLDPPARRQQMRGSCSPTEHVRGCACRRTPCAGTPWGRASGCAAPTFADDRGIRAVAVRAHGGQRRHRASLAATTHTILPSFATCKRVVAPASRTRRSTASLHGHGVLLHGDVGARACAASSFSVEARPPRVGSRKQRVCGAAASTSAIRWLSGAASLSQAGR